MMSAACGSGAPTGKLGCVEFGHEVRHADVDQRGRGGGDAARFIGVTKDGVAGDTACAGRRVGGRAGPANAPFEPTAETC
jgi:hypothetical protein